MEADRKYFFTATILNWKHLLSENKFKQIIINELKHQVDKGLLKVFAFVIMPNHMHLIISIPSPFIPKDVQRDLLKWISKQFITELKNTNSEYLEEFKVNAKDRTYQIWERNSLAIEIFSQEVIFQKLNYIHNNPTTEKWKLAATPEEYEFSTAGFYFDGRRHWDFINHVMP